MVRSEAITVTAVSERGYSIKFLYYLGSRVIETLSVMCKITAKPLS
jgi:hypothetical protein